MSVAGISTNLAYYNPAQNNSAHTNDPTWFQQFKQGLAQLGQDLQAGNLSAAQEEFANLPKPSQGSPLSSNNPISQSLKQLGQDLQSGNLSGADQDFKTLHQDLADRFGGGSHVVGGGPGGPAPVVPSLPSQAAGANSVSVTA